MNKATEVFKSFLDVIEFELVKHEDGYGLIDLQGANLGDIEGDRFQTASQIIERLDIYIKDYYLDDLWEEIAEVISKNGYDPFEAEIPTTAEEWVRFRAEPTYGIKEVEKFIEDHKHEFDVLDMIVNHTHEVELDEVTTCNE